MRTSALLLLAALSALAQSGTDPIWYIEVTATQDFVLSGRSLRLRAQAVTVGGVEVPNFTPEWRSSNPLVATVDSAGVVQGLVPGSAVIEAIRDGVAGRFTARVQPLRIAIDPIETTMDVGGEADLTARALNADGAPIPEARFVWYSGLPAVVSVDGAGTVRALAEGVVTVSAFLDVPDAGLRASAQATVRVRRRGAFRATRVISSDFETRPVTLKKIEQIAYAGGDRIALVAALANGSHGLLLLDGGNLQTLAVSGEYLEVTGQVIGSFGGISLNSAGDLLAQVQFPYWPHNRLLLYRGGRWEPAAVPPEFGGLQISQRALGERGEFAFIGWNNRGQNVMFRREDGQIERVLTQGDQIPGLGAIQWFREAVVTAPGKVVFTASDGRDAYCQWDGREVRKLVRTGDSLLGRTVQWLGPSPLAVASGDLYFVMGLDGQQLLRLSGGTWSVVFQPGAPLASGATVQRIDNLLDARGGVLLFSGGSDRGDGLFRLQAGNLELVAPYGQSEQNGEWRWFDAAFLQPSGRVIVKGTQGSQISRLARLDTGAATTLLDAGRSLDIAAGAGIDWGNLTGGGSATNLVFRAYTGGLMRVARNSLQPVVSLGDPMPPAGAPLVWIGSWASSSRGDFAFVGGTIQNQGLYLWRNRRLTLLAETNGEIKGPGGWNFHGFGWPIGVNNNGQVTVWTWGEGRNAQLVFTEGSRNVQLVVAPAAQEPPPWNAVIDDRGRVALGTSPPGSPPALYLWEAGRMQRIRQLGDAGPNGIPLANFEGPFRAAGDKLFAHLRYGEWGQPGQPATLEIVEFDGTGVRPLVSSTGCLGNQYSVNSAGELAYGACLPDGAASLVLRRTDGRDILVASAAQPSSEGDWFWQFLSWYLNDQGEVFFSAVTQSGLKDRITLYQAIP